ncbi:probable non-F420 flavinoid oxidoreductase [Desulfonatronum thiosulfatophilum]|uniref:Probable non-F420 flavinoid oxidoreductase n=1 Tax=Desulfonatronum thiosulfatophilum TaxID=617002 RepID=A0A1G6CJL3_9BACT|nr:TIGR03885 family FMN-dependent LLM class oxidoreductase [Desulfonatronum thiosulfatophilum]SDB33113.1 probable non-F420 flavinoid oxidoreductase [Desulfonatronum thiosulfatophilum]
MISYHASHEQFPPGKMLELAQFAEDSGFQSITCSDHFNPWSTQQGQSGFALSWLGASLQATGVPHGVVTAPGWRYHPAILAQAGATLSEMFPGRFWMALGSGELLNEGVVGQRWPAKAVRMIMLHESAQIVRSLWAGETVTHYGHVKVEEAKLYSLPAQTPMLIGAAISPETAEWIGGWADGMITISAEREKMNKVVEAFHRGGGKDKPMILKAQISYAQTDEAALQGAWQEWRTNIFDSSLLAQLRLPSEFEEAGKYVRPDDMHGHVRISSDLGKQLEWIKEDMDMGFSTITLHNVNREQDVFVRDFGPEISGLAK